MAENKRCQTPREQFQAKPTWSNFLCFFSRALTWAFSFSKLSCTSSTCLRNGKGCNKQFNVYWMKLSRYHELSKWDMSYQPKPKAEAGNLDTRFENAWYHAKAELNNCISIHFLNNLQKTFSDFAKVREQYKDEGLGNWRDFEHDKITAISTAAATLSCQLHKLLNIDWMLSTNQIFHSKSNV